MASTRIWAMGLRLASLTMPWIVTFSAMRTSHRRYFRSLSYRVRVAGLKRRLDHFPPQIRLGQVNVLERRFLFLMPHELLKGGQAHVFIRFVGTKGVPEGVHTHLLANPGLFDVLGH